MYDDILLDEFYTPLAICPGPIVEISPFTTDDVQTPTWRQILELIALAARFCLLPTLLLHRHQTYTCTHTNRCQNALH